MRQDEIEDGMGFSGLAPTPDERRQEKSDRARRDAVIEECAKAVPTNWCDSLLTGPGAPRCPLDNRGVEQLLRGVQDRIRGLKSSAFQ